MLRSMYSAVSGLKAHAAMMDTVSNNIANVNTTAFKTSVTRFSEILAQTLRGPSGGTSQLASTSGVQVGLGVSVGSVDRVFTQGPVLETGRQTDMAIQGEGMFVLARDTTLNDRVYTRDGSFSISNDGSITSPTGARLLGWNADSAGVVNTSNPLQALRVPIGGVSTSQTTANLTLKGNLSGSAVTGTVVNGAIYEFDSKGTSHTIPVTYTKTANPNEWQVGVGAITDPSISSAVPVSSAGLPFITFTPTGSVDTVASTFRGFDVFYNASAGLNDQVGAGAGIPGIAVDYTSLQQLAGNSEINQTLQDGFGPGTLSSFSISEFGELQGIFSNGHNIKLGVLALATFLSPSGLVQIGSNNFLNSPASGDPTIGQAGASGHGTIRGGAIEGSNTDLAQEFTMMIAAQRGFQSNAKIITASDEMLQELAQLKR